MTGLRPIEAPASRPEGPSSEPLRALEVALGEIVAQVLPVGRLRVHVAPSAAGADLAVRPVACGFELLLSALAESGGEALLARVPGELQVIEYSGALAALYMEEALREAPGAFFRRVGLPYLRERIDRDPAGRAGLFRRGVHRRPATSGCIGRVSSA